MRILILAFLIVIASSVATSLRLKYYSQCKANAILVNCKPCELTCDETKRPCAQVCSAGCVCKPGYIRLDAKPRSPCILKKDCPHK